MKNQNSPAMYASSALRPPLEQSVSLPAARHAAPHATLASTLDPMAAARDAAAESVWRTSTARNPDTINHAVLELPVIHHFLQMNPDVGERAPQKVRNDMANRVLLSQRAVLHGLLALHPDIVYSGGVYTSGLAFDREQQSQIRAAFAHYQPNQPLTTPQIAILTEIPVTQVYGILRNRPPHRALTSQDRDAQVVAAKRIEQFYEKGAGNALQGPAKAIALAQIRQDERQVMEIHDRAVTHRIISCLRRTRPNIAFKVALVSGYFHNIVPYVDERIAVVQEYDHASPYFPTNDRAKLIEDRSLRHETALAG